MPEFKVKAYLDFSYDDRDYSVVSKVYAIDTTRYRFLICDPYDGRFIWVNIQDCTLEPEEEKDD